MAKKKDLPLKETVEAKLAAYLAGDTPPDDQSMKLLGLAVKYLAVQAKLEEGEYGNFFDGDGDGDQEQQDGTPPRARKRANGAGRSDGDAAPGTTPSLLDG